MYAEKLGMGLHEDKAITVLGTGVACLSLVLCMHIIDTCSVSMASNIEC